MQNHAVWLTGIPDLANSLSQASQRDTEQLPEIDVSVSFSEEKKGNLEEQRTMPGQMIKQLEHYENWKPCITSTIKWDKKFAEHKARDGSYKDLYVSKEENRHSAILPKITGEMDLNYFMSLSSIPSPTHTSC